MVKAQHFTELRNSINAVRDLAGLAPFPFTDPSLSSSVVIKASHLADLRTALDAARSTLLLPTISYANPTVTPGASLISAVDLYDLRNGVR